MNSLPNSLKGNFPASIGIHVSHSIFAITFIMPLDLLKQQISWRMTVLAIKQNLTLPSTTIPYDINVWLSEQVAQSSKILEILNRLDKFTYKSHKFAFLSY